MMLFVLLVVSILNFSQALNCSECVNSGKIWCLDTSQCAMESCSKPVDVILNCPTLPVYGYDDEFMRTEIMVLTSAAQNQSPQFCFDNQLPTMKLYQIRTVNCSTAFNDVTCVGYTSFDTKRKVISISIEGGSGADQGFQLIGELLGYGAESYYTVTNGKILKIIHDSFMLLWNGGMHQDLRNLKYKYPNYELWVNGHSLGSCLAYAASSWIVNIGLYKPDDMKIAVMGAARVGDYNCALWHTNTFPFNFHIIHRDDPIPHTFKHLTASNTTLFFPKTEVWYDNYMREGDPYEVCQEAD